MKTKTKISFFLLFFILGSFFGIYLNLILSKTVNSRTQSFPNIYLETSAANATGTTELVSNLTIGQSNRPAIAIDDSENVYISWYNWSNSKNTYITYYRFKNSSTQIWSDIKIIAEDSSDPDIAVDANGNVFIAWVNYSYHEAKKKGIYVTRWDVNQKIWIEEGKISDKDATHDPSLTTDNSGNFHIVWHILNASDINEVYYRQWNATSPSWESIEKVSSQCFNHSYNPVITADNSNNLHVVWEDKTDYNNAGTDTDIFYRCRNTTKDSWGTIEVVTNGSSSSSRYAKVCVDLSGNIFIAWEMDWETVLFKFRNASTKVWSPTEIIPERDPTYLGFFSMDIDDNGNVYVVWAVDFGGSDIYHLNYRRWDSILRNWTMVKQISPESVYYSDYPDLVVNGSGVCYITWKKSVDSMIYFTKTSSDKPDSFTLDSDAETPDLDNFFELQWDDSNNADYYEIYNDTSLITDPNDATLVEDLYLDNNYPVNKENAGVYYYMVVAKNQFGNTSSNCLEVQVENAPGELTLSYTEDPNSPGDINLTWTAADYTNNYSVYSHSSFMSDFTDGEALVEEINELKYEIEVLEDGTYYYMVVAHNNHANTSSNCISVTIDSSSESSPSEKIPGYNLCVLLAVICTISSTILIRLKKKNL